MQPELNFNSVKYFRDRERISEADAETYKKFKYNPFVTVLPTILQLLLLMAVIEVIKAGINKDSLDMTFMGFNLSIVPLKAGNLYYLYLLHPKIKRRFLLLLRGRRTILLTIAWMNCWIFYAIRIIILLSVLIRSMFVIKEICLKN